MGAPKYNEFWKFRSTHGRQKLFDSPELLWEEAVKYFQWCVDNPLIEIDYRGKDAVKVELPKMQAFTWSGLEYYLDINLRRYRDAMNDSPNSGGSHDDFVQVVSRINNVIYNQKFTGAAAGFLKESIIARDLGLTDKSEIRQLNVSQTEYIDVTYLSDETLNELNNAAEAKRLEGKS